MLATLILIVAVLAAALTIGLPIWWARRRR